MAVRPVLLGAVLLVLFLWVRAQSLDSIETRALAPQQIRVARWQHVQLSLAATVLTIVIAVPLGVLLTRRFARWFKPIGLIVLLALWIGSASGRR